VGKRRLIALLVVIGALVGVYSLGAFRSARVAGPRALAEQWLAAVAADDAGLAVELARKLAPETEGDVPADEYLVLAKDNGVPREFFTQSYNKWDYQLWRHAFLFQQLARAIDCDNPDDVRKLFDAVVKRIEPREQKTHRAPWPYEIWRRRWGVCDRQSWVLCELAYQRGWQTQVVYLIDAKGVSPHTVCELRRPGGEVWFADPFRKVLLPEMSVDAVAADDKTLLEIWPDRPDFRAAIQGSIFRTPSYPQDYCGRNQRLHERLVAILGNRCPRFGEDPARRMRRYSDIRSKQAPGKKEFRMDVWFYPFRLLWHELNVDRARALR